MSVQELADRLADLKTSSGDKVQKQLELLEFINEQKLRCPNVVVQHGLDLIENHASSLGTKVWDIRESVFIAGLDSRRYGESKIMGCYKALETKFPTSNRVKLLKAMRAETQTDYKLAESTYDAIIAVDPGNMTARKRKVCILKAQNNVNAAIKELNSYLQIFAGDVDAWQELAQLYIQTQKLKLAKFCLEELLLIRPEQYLYHIQYAEVNYSLEDYDLAKQYYAQALELKPENNTRARFGLLMALRALPSSQDIHARTYQYVLDETMREYASQKAPEAVQQIVKSTLSLEVTST